MTRRRDEALLARIVAPRDSSSLDSYVLCYVQWVRFIYVYIRVRAREDRAVFNGQPLSRGWTDVTL